MADQATFEGSSSRNATDESSESTVELNIKTLDSHIYSFHVDKNMKVSAFKEKIASQIGVPVGQQRLIFRGKVLKDDHLLSEYHVESGHTLHLVERQPSQSQPSPGDSTGVSNTNNGSRGQEPGAGGPRNRIGQISHSVVLGTLNLGDQGDGTVPDLNRVIGAVLNSIGIGQIGGMQPGVQVPVPLVNEREGARGNFGNQSEAGNQPPNGQTLPGLSLPHVLPIPVGAPVAIPSVNAPIPNSLNTLLEFMNRMDQVLTQNADRSNQSPDSHGDRPTVEIPQNSRGVATPEGLGTVLRQAEQLIGARVVAALSHIAGRLEQEAGSTDAAVRGQIQTESVHLGLAMQHLGALFLELGRTILTLHMGQSPADSYLNAGPAVYISPSGPNPIMVQPFPLQTSSLFSSAAPASTNPGIFGPIGIGNIPRNVNIHIHAVGTRATNGEGSQGEHNNGTGTGPGDYGRTQVLPPRNIIATANPSQPVVIPISGGLQSGSAVPQAPVSGSLAAMVSEVNSQIRNLVDNMRNDQQASPGQSEASFHLQSSGSHIDALQSSDRPDSMAVGEDKTKEPQCAQPYITESTDGLISSKEEASTSSAGGSSSLSGTSKTTGEGAPGSSQKMNNAEGPSTTPIGLGLGGLQPKRRARPSGSQSGLGGGSATSNQEHTRVLGQHVLRSLASQGRPNADNPPSGFQSRSTGGIIDSISAGGQNGDGQSDIANAMSHMLQSPALDGLLRGVSEQTGIGRNTIQQMAQQIDGHDLGSMFSGLGGNQGGNIDLSRMIQQMMPIVSQVLGGGSAAVPQSTPSRESDLRQSQSWRDSVQVQENPQSGLRQVAQRIENRSSPREIFHSMVESAAELYNGSAPGTIINEVCREEELANEFMEMLTRDISRRLGGSAQ